MVGNRKNCNWIRRTGKVLARKVCFMLEEWVRRRKKRERKTKDISLQRWILINLDIASNEGNRNLWKSGVGEAGAKYKWLKFYIGRVNSMLPVSFCTGDNLVLSDKEARSWHS